MKLPLAKLNTAKLQSLKPFKKIARKLSAMETTRLERARNLARVKQEKSAYRIALTLLLVRPWVLVMGFWIFSMGIGALALGGMLSPKRLTMALPEPTVEPSVVSPVQSADGLANIQPSGIQADTAQSDSTQSNDTLTTTEPARADAASSSALTLALPLFLLVSTCAVGCFAISRQRTMKMAAARARVRKVRSGLTVSARANNQSSSSANGGRTKPNQVSSRISNSSKNGIAPTLRPQSKASVRKIAKTSSTPKKLDLKVFPQRASSPATSLANNLNAELQPKKRRQRSKGVIASQATASSTANSGKRLVSRATAARAGIQSQPASARSRTRSKKGTIRVANRRRHPASQHPVSQHPVSQPRVVSVMPAGDSHALDWREGSLAHQMDVRPQRSAM